MPFTCPKCGMTSHHPEDERFGYCGNCNEFTGGLRIVDYPSLLPKVPAWTWERMRQLAEKIKEMAAEWEAKGGRFVWPASSSPAEVTLAPYFAKPEGFTVPKTEALKFRDSKGRLRTAVELVLDAALAKELDPDKK